MNKNAVIGIGNPFRSDDGIGIILLNELIKRKKEFKNIDFIDGGTGGFNLLHDLSKYKKILIIDAVNMGKNPFESEFFNIENIKNNKDIHLNISTHNENFLDIIKLSEKLDEKPDKIYVFAVQPKNLNYNGNLSKELLENIDNYIFKLIEKIKENMI